MSKRWMETMVAVALLGVFLAFFLVGMGYSPRTRLMPLIAAGISAASVLGELVVQNLSKNRVLAVDTMELFGAARMREEMARVVEASPQGSAGGGRGGKVSTIVLWLVALAGMVLVLGFHLSLFLYPLAYLRFCSGTSWRFALVVGLLTWFTVFVLFQLVLGLELFPGLLFGVEL